MWRKAAAVCLVAAPIALTVATGVDPALGDDQGYGIYRQHPDALQWHSILLHWAWVLFVPGLMGLLAPIRQRGAVLARIAWLAIILGLTTFSALMANDFVLLAVEQNLPDAQVALFDQRFQELTVTIAGWQWPGLLGWILALVLTPIAAARARVIDWWTAGAALGGTGLYLAFAISPVPVNLLGPVVLIGAYGVAAWRLLRARPGAEPDSFGAFRRTFGRFSMYAAPIALAAGMVTAVEDFAADPMMTQVSALLLHVAWVLFVPAVLFLAEPANRFTRAAAGVTVVALINFGGLMVGDSADLAAHQAYGAAVASRVTDTLGGYPAFTFGWAMPGMLFSLLGLIVVAVGAAAGRVVRWWQAALIVAGVIGFLGLGLGPAGAIGPALMLAGFGLIAHDRRRPATTAPTVAAAV
jgi:hypothetical protein